MELYLYSKRNDVAATTLADLQAGRLPAEDRGSVSGTSASVHLRQGQLQCASFLLDADSLIRCLPIPLVQA